MATFNRVPFVYDSPAQNKPFSFRGYAGRGHYRGHDRGRGFPSQRSRGRGFPGPRFVSHDPVGTDSLPTDRGIRDGLSSEPITKIFSYKLPLSKNTIEITNAESIGSYNWLDAQFPTILVPGSPAVWNAKPFSYAVLPDTGVVVETHDSCRLPDAPLLPLMVAVEELQESKHKAFPWHTVDIMADRSNLRKLFRWIHGRGPNPTTFRIDLFLAGDRTILMKRWEKRDKELGNGFSYGMNFRSEATDLPLGCKGSVGHQHIVRYNMNGLSMVVRFGVDACLPSSSANLPEAPPKPLATARQNGGRQSSQPVNKFELLAPDIQSQYNKDTHGLDVRHGGTLTPLSNLVELTTRSEARKTFYDWDEGYPQLYLSQTMHHYLAIHHRGTFQSKESRQLDSPEMDHIRSKLQPRFQAFHAVLLFIRQIAQDYGENCDLSLVCENGQLFVYERLNRGSCLPDEYMDRFHRPRDNA
ncbi:hypothetical protein BDN72DRAFT_832775, partial [Pluteus cervinus]